MTAAGDISFELDRFEWASPDRLEVEGTWHGLRRRLPRATLVVEVEGTRRRLRALPEERAGSPEHWVAAFPWKGEMPKLPGAELEVGRGIVVDLPRPRRSKARGAAGAPADPLPASSRDERETVPGREEADRLLAVLSAARTEADEAAGRATAAEAKAETLRERAEAAEAELAATDAAVLGKRAEEAEAELDTVRARAEGAEAELAAADVSALRSRLEEAHAELRTLRTRAEDAEAEVETLHSRAEGAEAELAAADIPALHMRTEDAETEIETLRARAEAAEAELAPLRARAEDAEAELAALPAGDAPAAAPDVERLRAELQTVERERMELRAQLDTTAERLETAEEQTRSLRDRSTTAAMPGPRTAAAGHVETDEAPAGSRFGRAGDDDPNSPARRAARRPAQRTARRTDTTTAEPAGPPLGERISEWVGSLTGSRDEPQNGHAAEPKPDDVPPTSARSGAARAERIRSAQGVSAAARTRRRSDSRAAADRGGPSWILRAAAVGLLALLMIALLVIVFSLL